MPDGDVKQPMRVASCTTVAMLPVLHRDTRRSGLHQVRPTDTIAPCHMILITFKTRAACACRMQIHARGPGPALSVHRYAWPAACRGASLEPTANTSQIKETVDQGCLLLGQSAGFCALPARGLESYHVLQGALRGRFPSRQGLLLGRPLLQTCGPLKHLQHAVRGTPNTSCQPTNKHCSVGYCKL